MFGFVIIREKVIDKAIEKMDAASELIKTQAAEITDKDAKIEELQLKLYLQTLAMQDLEKERDVLVYNQRDNHGCLIRNKKK